ncbi:hypothetical protein D9M71_596650 [compost metagenome]
MPAFAIRRAFIAVKLQQVQGHCVEEFTQFATARIDEQAHGGHERRQRLDDRARLLERHRTGAFGIEHEADGIRPGLDGCQRILYAGNPTDLAANG